MKKLLFILTLLISTASFGQVYQKIATPYEYKNFRVTGNFAIPRSMPSVVDTSVATPIYFDVSDSTIKVYYGGAWLKMGGNNIVIIDTTGGDTTYTPGPGSGAVASVFGRVGHVLPQAGDYNFADLGNKPVTIQGFGITNGVRSDLEYSNPTWLTGLHVSKLLGFSGPMNSSTVLYGDWVFRNPTASGSPALVAISDGQNNSVEGVGTTVTPYRINVKHFADSVYKKPGTDSIYMRHSGVDRFMWVDSGGSSGDSIAVPGVSGQIIFNDGGSLGAGPALYNKSQNKLTADTLVAASFRSTSQSLSNTLQVAGEPEFGEVSFNFPIATIKNGFPIDPSLNYFASASFQPSPSYHLSGEGTHKGYLFLGYVKPRRSGFLAGGFAGLEFASLQRPAGVNIYKTQLFVDSSGLRVEALKLAGADRPLSVDANGLLKAMSTPLDATAQAKILVWEPSTNNLKKTGAVPEFADNAAAITGGLTLGSIYRTGDVLKIVHP